MTREEFNKKYPYLTKLDQSDLRKLMMKFMMIMLDIGARGEDSKDETSEMEYFMMDMKDIVSK